MGSMTGFYTSSCDLATELRSSWACISVTLIPCLKQPGPLGHQYLALAVEVGPKYSTTAYPYRHLYINLHYRRLLRRQFLFELVDQQPRYLSPLPPFPVPPSSHIHIDLLG